MVNCVSILGSTGSIGRQSLDIVKHLGIGVAALTAGKSVERMAEQCREFRPKLAVMATEEAAAALAEQISDLPVDVEWGEGGLLHAASMEEADCVITAVVGMLGLKPTLEAIRRKKRIGLANKETLVCAGELVMAAADRYGAEIVPVDSEHSAIFQCLQGCRGREEVKRILLTCSGGPFYGRKAAELQDVTRDDALQHPNWKMGEKITVDCATLMNKGLEVIEASWLFDMPEEKIQVVVHRESIIHSMIQYKDHGVIAQLGLPDMAVPIQYALTYPRRLPSPAGELDLCALGALTFCPPDEEAFPCLALCREALRRGGLVPAAANGANEQAVALFLEGKIGFLDIPRLVEAAMARQAPGVVTLEAVLEADKEARAFVAGAAH